MLKPKKNEPFLGLDEQPYRGYSLQDLLLGSSQVWTFLLKDRLQREGTQGVRDSSGDTIQDVRRFADENGWTRLVSRHSLQLGKIFLLLHLPILETAEKQRQGRQFSS